MTMTRGHAEIRPSQGPRTYLLITFSRSNNVEIFLNLKSENVKGKALKIPIQPGPNFFLSWRLARRCDQMVELKRGEKTLPHHLWLPLTEASEENLIFSYSLTKSFVSKLRFKATDPPKDWKLHTTTWAVVSWSLLGGPDLWPDGPREPRAGATLREAVRKKPLWKISPVNGLKTWFSRSENR